MLLKSVTLSSVISLAAAQSCASLYYQCGGLNWNGTTCCEAGSFCKSQNPYYYQCVASVTSANDTIAATQQADVSLSTSIPESVAAQSSVDGTNWNSTIAAAPHIPTPKATKSKKTVFVTKPASDQATLTVKKTTSTAPATLRHKHASSLINLNTSLVEIINTPSSAYETSIYSPASLNVTSEQPSATESVISETGADASIVSSSIISQGQPDIPTTIVAAEPSSSVYSESSESSAATVIENEEPAPSSTVSEIEESATVSSIAQPSSTVDSAASAESSAAVLKSSDAVDNELTFTPIAGGKSGTGETTRYWDCCKPSCAWSGKADVSSPVAACKADGKTISDVNDQSGCNGGDSYMCSNQQPFAINSTLAFGFAAASMVGYGESNMCCTCVLLTFNDGPVAGKQMVAQITNTGSDLSSNHFDIAMPGGGFGIFNQGCPNQWNSPASNWGQTYGGVSSESDCGNLPSELQTGCDWRWDFLENADNPSVSFVEIECPSQITDITGCKRN